MTINHLTAALLATAGFALFLRQILLSNETETFPCAPTGVQVAQFIGGVTFIASAALFWDGPDAYAGQAAPVVAVLSGVVSLYFWVMLFNLAVQRRPAHVWKRLTRVWERTLHPARGQF